MTDEQVEQVALAAMQAYSVPRSRVNVVWGTRGKYPYIKVQVTLGGGRAETTTQFGKDIEEAVRVLVYDFRRETGG